MNVVPSRIVIWDPSPPQNSSSLLSLSSSSSESLEGSTASCLGSRSALAASLVEEGSEDLLASLAAGTAITMITVQHIQHRAYIKRRRHTDRAESSNDPPFVASPYRPCFRCSTWSIWRIELFRLFVSVGRVCSVLLLLSESALTHLTLLQTYGIDSESRRALSAHSRGEGSSRRVEMRTP